MSITTAFAELRKRKLVARQNYLCCQSCALSALSKEYDETEPEKRPEGYVFFHKQDAERLNENGYTHVRFGVFVKRKGGTTALQVAKEAVAVLTKHGCPVDWEGDSKKALRVWKDEDTRRRLILKKLSDAA